MDVQFVGGVADGQALVRDDLPPYFFFYVNEQGLAVLDEKDDTSVDIKKAMYHRLGDTSIYVWVRTEE